jgi:hypothetical protein
VNEADRAPAQKARGPFPLARQDELSSAP